MSNDNGENFAFKRIYDEFRTAEMSKEYYEVKINKLRKIIMSLDIFLALFAGGSGVLSFALWNYQISGIEVGQMTLGALVGVAVIIGIGKPYMKYDEKIEKHAKMLGLYRSISYSLKDIVENIKMNKVIANIDQKQYELLRNTRGHFLNEEDELTDRNLIEEMQKRVNRKYPKEYFFYPSDGSQ